LNIGVVYTSLKVCVHTQLWRALYVHEYGSWKRESTLCLFLKRALYVHEYGSWKRESTLCLFLKNERDPMLTYGHKMPPTFKE